MLTILGTNKESFKNPLKNWLPPFEDKGWEVQNGINEFTPHGYEASFTAEKNAGVVYRLPSSMKGRSFSISAKEIKGGDGNVVSFWYYLDGVRHGYNISESILKVEDIFIPANADRILVKIQTTSIKSFFYLKDIQIEESFSSTEFSEREDVVKRKKSGIRLFGQNSPSLTGYIEASQPMTFKDDSKITLETRFKISGYAGTSTWGAPISLFRHGNSQGFNLIFRSTGVVICYGSDVSGYSTASIGYILPEGKWVTAKLVYDGGKFILYVDGVEVGRAETGNKISYKDVQLTMGKWASSYSSYFFDGVIEFSRVYEDDTLLIEYDFTNQDFTSFVRDDSNYSIHGKIVGKFKYEHRKTQDRILSKNMIPPLSEWEYYSGAYYKDGIAILDGVGAEIRSPLIDVKNSLTSIRLSADYFADEVSWLSASSNDGTKYGRLNNSSYFDKDMNPIKNNGGHTGNGNAVIVGKPNEWTRNDWLTTLGSQIKYVRFQIPNNSIYSPSVIKIKNPMATISKDDWTTFEEYKVASSSPSRRNHGVSSSRKKYPFSLVRSSVNVLGSKRIMINQPRLSEDGGIYVEEATKNIATREMISHIPYHELSRDGQNFTLLMNGVNRYITIRLADGEKAAGKTLAFSGYLKRNGMPFSIEGARNINTYNISASNKLMKSDLETGYFEAIEYYDHSSNNWIFHCPITNEVGDIITIEKLQIEEKGYSTSLTIDDRSDETMVIKDFKRYIDLERGSMELEFLPLNNIGDAPSGLHRFHDIVFYDAVGGIIVGRNSRTIQYHSRNVSKITDNPMVLEYRDDGTMNYKIQWNKEKDTCELIVNGNVDKKATLPMFALPRIGDLYIGSRDDERAGKGNAIYKKFTVRNRFGETVFKL